MVIGAEKPMTTDELLPGIIVESLHELVAAGSQLSICSQHSLGRKQDQSRPKLTTTLYMPLNSRENTPKKCLRHRTRFWIMGNRARQSRREMHEEEQLPKCQGWLAHEGILVQRVNRPRAAWFGVSTPRDGLGACGYSTRRLPHAKHRIFRHPNSQEKKV